MELNRIIEHIGVEPYYREDAGVIYCADCLDIMKRIPDNSVDLIVTDPPFFMPATHYQSRISWGRCWGDLSILGQFFFDLVKEYRRLLKSSGHLFVFCNDQSYPVFYPVIYGLYDFSRALIWDKMTAGLGKIFRHRYEIILWASDKGAEVINDGKLHTNILSYRATPSSERCHPVEKPTDLMGELINVCSANNALILDSFLGGGNTIKAAKELGRCYIGIEISSKYCQIAVQRLAQEILKV